MAQYKVLQDIEADDKLLGPLSLRQFIYAIIVVVLGFVAFRLGTIAWYLAVPFAPPMVFFGLLAAPFGRDQPSEVWLLAKIRFFLKSRRRIWDQSGVKELVTITVPKKIERITSKGFSEQEVRSRLKALSSTLDTRGWAVKNVDVATFRPVMVGAASTSDRLVDISTLPTNTPQVTVDPASDILDEDNNPVAQQVDQRLAQSAQEHRQELLDRIQAAAEAKKIEQEFASGTVKAAPVSERMQSILADIEKQQSTTDVATNNLRRLEPTPPAPQQPVAQVTNAPAPVPPQVPAQTPVTPPSDPGILKLVKNNDLNVATISRQANKKGSDESSDGEVVISLR